MSYTPHDYLNKIIQAAIDDGMATEDEISSIVYARGSNTDQVTVDILSVVYQRGIDIKKLEEFQRMYRDYRNGLQPK